MAQKGNAARNQAELRPAQPRHACGPPSSRQAVWRTASSMPGTKKTNVDGSEYVQRSLGPVTLVTVIHRTSSATTPRPTRHQQARGHELDATFMMAKAMKGSRM